MLALAAAHNLISTFQAIVLGVLQGATELFPVSSLGHTVLFPNLFGWHNVVAWQSQSESPWLAFVVMLHVGSAIGLLIYFWRDWVAIIKAFFATLRKRRIETPTERLAWLIICATIPVGILGLALEHPVRVALAKPLYAAIFLMVNGVILLAAERYRRRTEVRELAVREGTKEDGGRRLDSLEYREAGVIGVAQSTALIAGISRDGIVMTTGLVRGLDNADAAR
ncbi:MAG TPA: undecaprenyl-diphosphate phosphatase, partial [Solirubrobacteraceae bacterium]